MNRDRKKVATQEEEKRNSQLQAPGLLSSGLPF